MIIRKNVLALALAVGVMVANATVAQAGLHEDCSQDANARLTVSACTLLIESGRFAGRTLAMLYYNRGVGHTDLKEPDRAYDDYNSAIRIDPSFALPYYNRGLFYYQERKDSEKALADYSASIRLDPSYARAYNNRGNVYRNLQRLDEALADFNTAIRLDPQLSQPYNNRGLIFKSRKEYEKALADYSTAIRLNSRYANAYSNRGDVYEALGRNAEAIADFRAALAIDPTIRPSIAGLKRLESK